MPIIRKFYLQNAAGERFPLQGERGVWFTLPEGLGYELAPVFGDLGRGFFSVLDDEAEPQGTVAGTLVFVDGPYTNYRSFADWLAAAGSLLLIYCPFGDREYQKAVAVQYLQKGELSVKGRLLSAPFALSSLSPWRLPTPTEIILGAGYSDRRGRYSGRYPGRYGQDAAGIMTARIAAAGHLPGALRLRYTGGIYNPELRLIGVNSGTVYGSCKLSGSIGATDTLELLTWPEDSHVRKISAAGVVTDLLPNADLSRDPFPRVPVDEPSLFSVTSPSSFSGRAELLIYYFFRTV